MADITLEPRLHVSRRKSKAAAFGATPGTGCCRITPRWPAASFSSSSFCCRSSDLIFAPHTFDDVNWDFIDSPPNFAAGFYFGTDQNGRDLFVRTLYGGRVSITIGVVATLVSLVIGVSWGAIAGFVGGRVDDAMMRIVDILYSLPFIFFVIMLTVVFGRYIVLMYVAIGAVSWLDMARIVRGQTLSLKRKEFVEAAHASGVSTFNIIRRHIVPNTLGPVIIYVTLTVPTVMLTESFISFLGMGVQEPNSSWGVLVSEGSRTWIPPGGAWCSPASSCR